MSSTPSTCSTGSCWPASRSVPRRTGSRTSLNRAATPSATPATTADAEARLSERVGGEEIPHDLGRVEPLNAEPFVHAARDPVVHHRAPRRTRLRLDHRDRQRGLDRRLAAPRTVTRAGPERYEVGHGEHAAALSALVVGDLAAGVR